MTGTAASGIIFTATDLRLSFFELGAQSKPPNEPGLHELSQPEIAAEDHE